MSLSIRQIHPVFVGEVSGIDIARPLTPDEVAAIEAGMDRYAVLVFHDQKITDEQQMVFSRNFGPLEDAPRRQHHQAGRPATSNGHERRLQPRPGRPAARRAPRASACSTWATCSGTPTARSGPSRPSTRCSRPAS